MRTFVPDFRRFFGRLIWNKSFVSLFKILAVKVRKIIRNGSDAAPSFKELFSNVEQHKIESWNTFGFIIGAPQN